MEAEGVVLNMLIQSREMIMKIKKSINLGCPNSLLKLLLVSGLVLAHPVGAAEGKIQSLMTPDIYAPIALDETDHGNRGWKFIILQNIAGAVPTEPAVLWWGDVVIANINKNNEGNKRVSFCVTEVITKNGDQIRSNLKSDDCLGSIHDVSGMVGLDSDKAKKGARAIFIPAVDLVRVRAD